MTVHRLLIPLLLVSLAACAAREARRPDPFPKPRPRQSDVNASWQQRATNTPMATPTSAAIDETTISERGGMIVTDDMELETPTRRPPTPTATPAADPEIVAAIPKSESLLPRITPGLPPNQAAALRVVEEGRKLVKARQYDQAIDRLERGVSIDPTNAYGYYYLAQANYLKKDYSQAVAFAGRAVSLSVRTDRKWVSRAYTLQAEIFEEVGRYRDARASYTKAMKADPQNLSARVGAARVNPSTEGEPATE